MDYVSCWYKKAANLMKLSPRTQTSLVSTNSTCQGGQVANLWQKLFEERTMPAGLRRVHQDNDRAVMAVFDPKIIDYDFDSPIVAELFKMYQEMTK